MEEEAQAIKEGEGLDEPGGPAVDPELGNGDVEDSERE
jgi:hypothetical protein